MMKQQKYFVSGNEAVALGVQRSRTQVVTAYPITPQTVAMERLSEMVADGELRTEFMLVESEHSALSAAMGASAMGTRTFTATSSQGLLYMAECLHYASGGRWPIVMMNANRSVALPWSIFGDQRDSLSLLDSGWIQVYVEDAQEAFDMIIQAFAIAEDEQVLTPVMVNLDGFTLTHTYEPVFVPTQEAVDAFLPPYQAPVKMDLDRPLNMAFSSTPPNNMEFKYQQHQAMEAARPVIAQVEQAFHAHFGRAYGGLIDAYRCDDAERILVTVGTVTGTARQAVDQLREQGQKVGLLKIRFMRPFPHEEVARALRHARAVGVLDRDISFGYEGTVFTNVNSALIGNKVVPPALNFIAGLGGRDIGVEDIEKMFERLAAAMDGKAAKRVEFIHLGVATDE
ncbi:transketolase C-terminal domain-containing protein [Heliophilum fasciatum]|uniref:Pyruvate ferredoxin oxidoreductase alpha subunit n=1 Tax=Heliophilum fasciatum TaxID=35700 RepID=A0A4R2S0K2_9FIRM|nr:transketolase C-terminal domain-containing protein [Heliophilum fasciatum]MCW2276822.1 pyruvate ferredoxin oxidoreductase alpha subunit [Heliophilum fasciatum]TCP68717.1 pyruvate ferredoxin oxidoreductase alpha subunit [Heliophilum fasciatum]